MAQKPVLHFLFQTGCPACAVAEPVIEAFLREDRTRTCFVVKKNLALVDWSVSGWSPRAMPGYALTQDGALLAQHVGVLKLAGLKRFVERGLKGEPFEDGHRHKDGGDVDQDEEGADASGS